MFEIGSTGAQDGQVAVPGPPEQPLLTAPSLMAYPPADPAGVTIVWYKSGLGIHLDESLLPNEWPVGFDLPSLDILTRWRAAKLIKPHISDTAVAVYVSRHRGGTPNDVLQLSGIGARKENELRMLGEVIMPLPRRVHEWLRASSLGYGELQAIRLAHPSPEGFTVALLHALDDRRSRSPAAEIAPP